MFTALKKQLFTVWVFFLINTKRFFRDRLAIFFSIGFPLIFLFVFGGLNSGSSDISFNVALLNQSQTDFAAKFETQLKDSDIISVDPDITTLDAAKERMSRSELDGVIVLPESFGAITNETPTGEAQILYTQNNSQSGAALTSNLGQQLAEINSEFVDTSVPFTVKGERLNERSLSAFDYAFAGLVGFAIIGMGIFGPMSVFPELKKMGILRRLSTTPLRVWQYFLATMMGQAVIGLIGISIMFIVAILVFNLEVVGNWFELAGFIVLGIVMILGIGLSIGGWAKNERQAAPLGNIIVFPLMFLSGTFFPRFLMPEWLQNVSSFLPLTPVIDGIRLIATEGRHLIDILPQLGLIGIWMVVIYFIAFRVFRWE
jgi:ABC-2 type transport system permease protein